MRGNGSFRHKLLSTLETWQEQAAAAKQVHLGLNSMPFRTNGIARYLVVIDHRLSMRLSTYRLVPQLHIVAATHQHLL